MGLDGVEFIIALEDALDISLEDEELEHCTTPRKLTDYVFSKLEQTNKKTCLTQRSFYILRKAFREILNIPRNRFKRNTPLEQLVPRDDRKEIWCNLKKSVGVNKWPDLVRPSWLILLLCILVPVLTVASFNITGASTTITFLSYPASLIVFIVATLCSAFFSRPAAVNFKPKDVEGLVRYLVGYDPKSLKGGNKEYSREEVRSVIAELLNNQLCITEFNDDDDFHRDLGID